MAPNRAAGIILSCRHFHFLLRVIEPWYLCSTSNDFVVARHAGGWKSNPCKHEFPIVMRIVTLWLDTFSIYGIWQAWDLCLCFLEKISTQMRTMQNNTDPFNVITKLLNFTEKLNTASSKCWVNMVTWSFLPFAIWIKSNSRSLNCPPFPVGLNISWQSCEHKALWLLPLLFLVNREKLDIF